MYGLLRFSFISKGHIALGHERSEQFVSRGLGQFKCAFRHIAFSHCNPLNPSHPPSCPLFRMKIPNLRDSSQINPLPHFLTFPLQIYQIMKGHLGFPLFTLPSFHNIDFLNELRFCIFTASFHIFIPQLPRIVEMKQFSFSKSLLQHSFPIEFIGQQFSSPSALEHPRTTSAKAALFFRSTLDTK